MYTASLMYTVIFVLRRKDGKKWMLNVLFNLSAPEKVLWIGPYIVWIISPFPLETKVQAFAWKHGYFSIQFLPTFELSLFYILTISTSFHFLPPFITHNFFKSSKAAYYSKVILNYIFLFEFCACLKIFLATCFIIYLNCTWWLFFFFWLKVLIIVLF